MIRDAIEAGLAEAVIDDHVIGPAMVLVGDLWADGRITIAEEHLATSISVRVLMLQREAFRVARRRATQRVLLAGAEGELHVVGLEMAGSVIVHAGYDVRLFGADLPVAEIASAIDRHRPAVIGFTSATPVSAANLPAAFDAVRRVSPETGIVVGGRGVDDMLRGHLGRGRLPPRLRRGRARRFLREARGPQLIGQGASTLAASSAGP